MKLYLLPLSFLVTETVATTCADTEKTKYTLDQSTGNCIPTCIDNVNTYLDGNECVDKACTCDNGVAAKGADCSANEHKCDKCNIVLGHKYKKDSNTNLCVFEKCLPGYYLKTRSTGKTECVLASKNCECKDPNNPTVTSGHAPSVEDEDQCFEEDGVKKGCGDCYRGYYGIDKIIGGTTYKECTKKKCTCHDNGVAVGEAATEDKCPNNGDVKCLYCFVDVSKAKDPKITVDSTTCIPDCSNSGTGKIWNGEQYSSADCTCPDGFHEDNNNNCVANVCKCTGGQVPTATNFVCRQDGMEICDPAKCNIAADSTGLKFTFNSKTNRCDPFCDTLDKYVTTDSTNTLKCVNKACTCAHGQTYANDDGCVANESNCETCNQNENGIKYKRVQKANGFECVADGCAVGFQKVNKALTVADIFNLIDLDKDGVLSDQELSLLVARSSQVIPITSEDITDLEEKVKSCLNNQMPQVTLNLVENCPVMLRLLQQYDADSYLFQKLLQQYDTNSYDHGLEYCTDRICSCPDGTAAIGSSCPAVGLLKCTSCNTQIGRTFKIENNECIFECTPGYTKAANTNDCIQNVCQCSRGTANTGANCRTNGLSCAKCTQYTNAVKQPSLLNNCQDEPTCKEGYKYDRSQDSCIVKISETTAAPVVTSTVAEKTEAETTAAPIITTAAAPVLPVITTVAEQTDAETTAAPVAEETKVETTAAPIVSTTVVEEIDTTTAAPIASTTVAEQIEASTTVANNPPPTGDSDVSGSSGSIDIRPSGSSASNTKTAYYTYSHTAKNTATWSTDLADRTSVLFKNKQTEYCGAWKTKIDADATLTYIDCRVFSFSQTAPANRRKRRSTEVFIQAAVTVTSSGTAPTIATFTPLVPSGYTIAKSTAVTNTQLACTSPNLPLIQSDGKIKCAKPAVSISSAVTLTFGVISAIILTLL